MSKRERSDRRDRRDDDTKRRRREDPKRLYLVLDDWEKGYSIHRIDDRAFGYRYGAHELELPLALALAPVLRLEASRGVLLGALGSKVVALWQPAVANRTVAYDTKTSGLAVGPPHPAELRAMRFVVAAGKKLCAVHEGGVHCLDMGAEQHQWAWTTASSSPLRLPGCDHDGPVEITSYAMHPDGRTVFVSAHARDTGPGNTYAGTFSLDTGGGGGDAGWTPRGEWMLPFQGQGHYDADLDAWVGLHSRGYMCTCEVPAPLADASAPPQPTWELVSADSLFYADPDPRRGDSAVSLVSMGKGEFCLVESSLAKGEFVYAQLRLTRFRFERDRRHGRPRASSRHFAVLSCKVRKFDSLFSPRVFCL